MTKLHRFGFGGFDEKPTPPFDSFHTDGRDYDFRHVQSMTKETDKVEKESQTSSKTFTNCFSWSQWSKTATCRKGIKIHPKPASMR